MFFMYATIFSEVRYEIDPLLINEMNFLLSSVW